VTSERETALLRQILDRPDDREVREIYADALLSRGEPRGEMIALELAGRRAAAAVLRRAHAATWWPELASLPFATRGGFVERIHTRASRLAELQPLFAREPIRELELDRGGPIVDPLPPMLVRLALAGDHHGLATIDRTRLERLELTAATHDSLRNALALEWPAIHTLRLTGSGLPAAWRTTVRDGRTRLPRFARLELFGINLDDIALVSLRTLLPGIEIVAGLGPGPLELDLDGTTLSLANTGDDAWHVEADGEPVRVRWRRVLQRTGHAMHEWTLGDAAPLDQVASAIARNAPRVLDRGELELRLPTIQQNLETVGVMTYQAYDTVWELVETARLAYDAAERELSVTFLERHVRPDLDDEEALFD